MRQRLSRLVAVPALLVLAGCSTQPPPAAPATAPTAPAAQSQAQPAPTTAPSPTVPAAASPAASPITAPRNESKGRAVYAWQTAIAPAWLDPQDNGALVTPYIFQYILHDAVVKHLPGQTFAPSLAERYEIAPDFKSATFRLRENVKFHNGDPVTSEDVKFTYENYRGANAQLLKSKTEQIETPDARTIKFTFKEPFLDFLILYGTPASGAGWVVPAKYYQQVGADEFKKNPIGAGPFKLVQQKVGEELEFEAFADYWRHPPFLKTFIVRGVPEDTTRVAQLKTGEVDLIFLGPGPLVETVKNDPNLQLAAALGAMYWIEMVGWEKPDSPFHDIRVRQAVSLALDRDAINQAEYLGLAQPVLNWVPDNWPGGITGPAPEHNLARAKQLLAEAGYPNGLDVDQITPITGSETVAERIIGHLREAGIRTRLNRLERAAFDQKMREGPTAITGLIYNASSAPGDVMSRIRAFATCKGVNSRTCVPEIDDLVARHDQSTNPQERERLAADLQRYMWENHIFIGVFRQAALGGVGPRIANRWEDIWGAIPQYSTFGPYEDIQVKD
ncbi:MAG TPA: ABC transporter substrate-binding protein [Dehalococcoidia bacterium]|nr:ABC transporter substrate-binding protein [Dehalococcoidia bacterium]